jgi:molybdate transport system permease protein
VDADDILGVVRLSVIVALTAVALLAAPGIALGWLLARVRFPGRALLDAVVHAPLVLPPVALGWLLLELCRPHGLLGAWLHPLGLDLVYTWKGAAVAAALMAAPLLIRAVRLAIELVDPKLEEAARTCGAPPWRVFATVTLPLAAPGILAGLVLAFARSLGEYGATITLCGDLPGETRTLPVAIHALLDLPGDHGEAPAAVLAALSLVVALAALIGSDLLGRWLTRRLRG